MPSSTDTMFWIGEQGVPVKRNREHDNVIDSVIHYYNKKTPSLGYVAGKLLLDSGAFTASMRGLELSRERVINIQEKFNPSLAIPLDYPIRPGMSIKEMEDAWRKTKDNIIYWQSNTRLSNKILPTLHSWNDTSLRNNIKWIQKYIDAEYVAVGVVVGEEFTNFRGFFRDRQPTLDIIHNIYKAISIIKKETDFKVHIMGMGSSPLMLHIAYFLGADSTDSSGWRRKAAYGKIILPGTGERYVCNKSGKFSRKRLTVHERELLEKCQCEVCISDPNLLYKDWRARAIHNEYVIKKEAEKAKTFLDLGKDTYEKHLDMLFSKSKCGLQYIWKHVKLLIKYEQLPVR